MKKLYQYASTCDFSKFNKLFLALTTEVNQEHLADAYMMRAQIKLFASDETCYEDFARAESIGGGLTCPCLYLEWPCDRPNRFIVFSQSGGAFEHFVQKLDYAEAVLDRRYGSIGGDMARQVRAEILYFMGNYAEAVDCIIGGGLLQRDNWLNRILSQCALFRCYLALGVPEKAQDCMMDMVRIANARPECIASYQSIRNWTNLTTGWSGDTPRFYDGPNGKILPSFDDRIGAIRDGFSQMTSMEEPFIGYAEGNYPGVVPMRQYYMDIFHSIYWFQAGDFKQTESAFRQAYSAAFATGLTMPLIEYGKQIVPLLQYIKASDIDCSHAWIDRVIAAAEQYERSLDAYRQ